VGSKKSDVFHLPSCRQLRQIRPEDLVTFDDVQAALRQGRRPCKACRPAD
jgi:methylphosphotriester-DNA--protein-cysteine methyltransferase